VPTLLALNAGAVNPLGVNNVDMVCFLISLLLDCPPWRALATRCAAFGPQL
jgi:hypothetical protein